MDSTSVSSSIIDALSGYSSVVVAVATVILVVITAYYVVVTRNMLQASERNAKLSLNPVIGIEVLSGEIGRVFGPQRRNMGFEIRLRNVGNAPALEVRLDAEIMLSYSTVNGARNIPARHEPSMISFIESEAERQDQVGFGNRLIEAFFEDVEESLKLNLDRIHNQKPGEPFDTSRLRVIAYYLNSLGQAFRSTYEVEIHLHEMYHQEQTDFQSGVPSPDESRKVDMKRLPTPVFRAEAVDTTTFETDSAERDKRRSLSGW